MNNKVLIGIIALMISSTAYANEYDDCVSKEKLIYYDISADSCVPFKDVVLKGCGEEPNKANPQQQSKSVTN